MTRRFLPLIVWLCAAPVTAQMRTEPIAPEPLRAFAASAFVPGLGQRMLGQDRWVPYVVVEAWGLFSWLRHRSDAHDLERRYRDLAWNVARRVSTGDRVDPAFDYYESLAHYEASGAFDANPEQPGVQPEPDPTTYNGNVWRLARALYVPGGGNPLPGSPAHDAAMAYYMENAVAPEFAWAWGSSTLEQRVYAQLIDRSDDAFRAASQAIGLLIANHLVSAIDALISARLRQTTGLDVHLRGGLEGAGSRTRWRGEVRVGW